MLEEDDTGTREQAYGMDVMEESSGSSSITSDGSDTPVTDDDTSTSDDTSSCWTGEVEDSDCATSESSRCSNHAPLSEGSDASSLTDSAASSRSRGRSRNQQGERRALFARLIQQRRSLRSSGSSRSGSVERGAPPQPLLRRVRRQIDRPPMLAAARPPRPVGLPEYWDMAPAELQRVAVEWASRARGAAAATKAEWLRSGILAFLKHCIEVPSVRAAACELTAWLSDAEHDLKLDILRELQQPMLDCMRQPDSEPASWAAAAFARCADGRDDTCLPLLDAGIVELCCAMLRLGVHTPVRRASSLLGNLSANSYERKNRVAEAGGIAAVCYVIRLSPAGLGRECLQTVRVMCNGAPAVGRALVDEQLGLLPLFVDLAEHQRWADMLPIVPILGCLNMRECQRELAVGLRATDFWNALLSNLCRELTTAPVESLGPASEVLATLAQLDLPVLMVQAVAAQYDVAALACALPRVRAYPGPLAFLAALSAIEMLDDTSNPVSTRLEASREALDSLIAAVVARPTSANLQLLANVARSPASATHIMSALAEADAWRSWCASADLAEAAADVFRQLVTIMPATLTAAQLPAPALEGLLVGVQSSNLRAAASAFWAAGRAGAACEYVRNEWMLAHRLPSIAVRVYREGSQLVKELMTCGLTVLLGSSSLELKRAFLRAGFVQALLQACADSSGAGAPEYALSTCMAMLAMRMRDQDQPSGENLAMSSLAETELLDVLEPHWDRLAGMVPRLCSDLPDEPLARAEMITESQRSVPYYAVFALVAIASMQQRPERLRELAGSRDIMGVLSARLADLRMEGEDFYLMVMLARLLGWEYLSSSPLLRLIARVPMCKDVDDVRPSDVHAKALFVVETMRHVPDAWAEDGAGRADMVLDLGAAAVANTDGISKQVVITAMARAMRCSLEEVGSEENPLRALMDMAGGAHEE